MFFISGRVQKLSFGPVCLLKRTEPSIYCRVLITSFVSRPRVRRKEADRQISRGSQAGWSVQNHGDRIHDH